MKTNFEFFKTQMPISREADIYLGCLNSAVFIDFNQSAENIISLSRISFDGYGCCNIADPIHLSKALSNQFLEEIEKNELNQPELATIIKQIILINEKHIWKEALNEYGLIDN